jgi:hypothetical protein
MGKVWLGSLPDVLRNAGLKVATYPGWETRSRSTGGYEALLGLQVHHTASNTTPANDMRYMWEVAADKPIGAVHLDRTGVWTVGAAGATNTSGRGGPMITSKGTVPLDRGNLYFLSVEAANNGVGETWPDAQLWSYVIGSKAICDAYGLNPLMRGDINGHFEWTTRKVDPAGPSWYSPDLRSWDMNKFRRDVSTAAPVIPPLQGVPDVFYPIRPFRNSDTRAYGGKGIAPNTKHTFGLNPNIFPANITAVAVNIAVVPAGNPGWLMVWPFGEARPNPVTSMINFEADGAHNGAAILGVRDRKFEVELSAQGHVIVDVTGYWTA